MVFVGGDEFPAAITNIESTHRGTGNPFAMSKISVTLATTGSQPRIKIPASQFEKILISRLRTSPQDIFAEHRVPARETAKIITGNLLAGYGQLRGSQGTIITFTKDDGSIEQGILLPKKFDIATDVTGDYELRTAKQVADFLAKGGKDAEEVGEYLNPGSYAKLSAEAQAVADAGGRLKQNTLQLQPFQKLVNAARNAKFGEAALSIPGAILQTAIAPVMEHWVCR